MKKLNFLLAIAAIATACGKKNIEEKPAVPVISYSVVNTFPHDTTAFTEGLLVHDGQLYESTGEKESWIGVVDVRSGRTERKTQLDPKYFGEGMCILNNKVYYLTWKHNTGFVYDLKTFKQLKTFSYKTEGWGMTTDGKDLIMSDGTNTLTFLDSASLEPVKTLTVTSNGEPIKAINELEYIDGSIYANVWQTSEVIRIDSKTGNVTGVLDLSDLTNRTRELKPRVDVLNGIAWHEKTRLMMVTGKFWPYIYVLKIK